MGGERFDVRVKIVNGSPTAAEAFAEARDEALYDHGHSGYTGTIAEKPSFITRREKPLTELEVEKFIDDDGDENEKWGPAFHVIAEDGIGGLEHVFYGWASS